MLERMTACTHPTCDGVDTTARCGRTSRYTRLLPTLIRQLLPTICGGRSTADVEQVQAVPRSMWRKIVILVLCFQCLKRILHLHRPRHIYRKKQSLCALWMKA